jgi:hypothetical protein
MAANKEIITAIKFVLDTKKRIRLVLEEELVIWFFTMTVIGRATLKV